MTLILFASFGKFSSDGLVYISYFGSISDDVIIDFVLFRRPVPFVLQWGHVLP